MLRGAGTAAEQSLWVSNKAETEQERERQREREKQKDEERKVDGEAAAVLSCSMEFEINLLRQLKKPKERVKAGVEKYTDNEKEGGRERES